MSKVTGATEANREQLSGLREEAVDPNYRARRREFYERVLSIRPINPSDDLRGLCKEWRLATGAKWVWLWLFHPDHSSDVGHWELSAADADGFLDNYILDDLRPSDARCTVAELANAVRLPIYVPDLIGWSKTYNGRLYRVVCANDLIKMGCKSLLCVPLIAPPILPVQNRTPTSKFSQPLKAAVCLHFDETSRPYEEGIAPLLLMGKLSAHSIGNIFDAELHRIMGSMNSLAAEFLTRKSKRRPADDRKEYLDKVIALVCEKLKTEYASVFYRNAAKKLVYCVATNSLYDAHGNALMNEERLFRNAVYRRNVGLTGKVFASGKPFFSRIGEAPARGTDKKYKYRETPVEVDENELAWVIYPIYSATPTGDQTPEVLGVFRCVGSKSVFKQKRRNIDPMQIQTLDFILRMLGPVLETMDANIDRERVISIIKHDLFAPLKMGRDLVKEASKRIDEGKPLAEHFLPDLQFCLLTARSLAAGLDQSPTEVRDFHPTPLKMEADIVAGIKNMLTPHAWIENQMRIVAGNIKGVFPPLISVDRDLISRALCNLILNAVKYGAENSTIVINAHEDERGWYLVVQNKGEPIPEADRDRIFEEGYRSESAKKKFGLGMGLPIARAIMQRHGGSLKLVPSPEFTIFSMFFPAHLKCEEE